MAIREVAFNPFAAPMRLFIIGKSPSAFVGEPILFNGNHMWQTPQLMKPLVKSTADAYADYLAKYGSAYSEFEVRLVDQYGRPVEVDSRVVERNANGERGFSTREAASETGLKGGI